jgi:3-deoxy-D-manno-octulosonic-acid transferase
MACGHSFPVIHGIFHFFYQLALPLVFLAAFPGWVVKMIRRGGFGTRLAERVAWYGGPADYEPCGAVHLHAISVGECMLALKLIRVWRELLPDQAFVIAVGTATGHAVAAEARIPGLRVTYAPLDFSIMVRRYLKRFEPERVVLIEGEIWPNLMRKCTGRGVPVSLVNARMSPRSARRLEKAAWLARPYYSLLSLVALQFDRDRWIWEKLGVNPEKIAMTGSLKFDPGPDIPRRRPEFSALLDQFGNRPVVLAASTHAGEEAWLAKQIHKAIPEALPVIVPRHAERRSEVRAELERAGFSVVMRSAPALPAGGKEAFVIDTTGELRDWTAHADIVIIGKSFMAHGGQNPAEAILADKPLIFGPHMENFEPLADDLVKAGGATRASDPDELIAALHALQDDAVRRTQVDRARQQLANHAGAAERIVKLVRSSGDVG